MSGQGDSGIPRGGGGLRVSGNDDGEDLLSRGMFFLPLCFAAKEEM